MSNSKKTNLETGSNATILTFKGITPEIDESVFLCSGVKIIGDVKIGKDSSVWYNTVIRGDVNYIRIGERTNIQDLSMLHVTHDKYPLNIGNDVTIGHSTKIHGATLYDCCLIGIGACLLDGCVINSNSFVAAGALVTEGFVIPEGTLVAGIPAKIIRDLTSQERERIAITSKNYLKYVNEYKEQLKRGL
jgi:carbonic anhydrase/acetyltransferase-like protein (isoleucine patch superfamily)